MHSLTHSCTLPLTGAWSLLRQPTCRYHRWPVAPFAVQRSRHPRGGLVLRNRDPRPTRFLARIRHRFVTSMYQNCDISRHAARIVIICRSCCGGARRPGRAHWVRHSSTGWVADARPDTQHARSHMNRLACTRAGDVPSKQTPGAFTTTTTIITATTSTNTATIATAASNSFMSTAISGTTSSNDGDKNSGALYHAHAVVVSFSIWFGLSVDMSG